MGATCDRGLRFTFANSVPQVTQDEVGKAIFQPWPGTSGKKITAQFTGTLRKDPEEQRFFPYIFEVSSVENLKIEIGKRPW